VVYKNVVCFITLKHLDIILEESVLEHFQKLANTLTTGEMNHTNYVQSLDAEAQETFYDGFMSLLGWLIYHHSDNEEEKIFVDNSASSTSFDTEGDAITLDSTSREIQSSAYHTCSQRRIFLMSNRSYGLGPQCMRAGDVVVVLYEGNTPYVLRRKDNRYLFMGQAYVNEIMLGQILQEIYAGERQEQELCVV
jgi:hypothetical protein